LDRELREVPDIKVFLGQVWSQDLKNNGVVVSWKTLFSLPFPARVSREKIKREFRK